MILKLIQGILSLKKLFFGHLKSFIHYKNQHYILAFVDYI